MRSVLQHQKGSVDTLAIGELEKPQPADDEMLLKIHCAGVNRPDLLQREGLYPPPAGHSKVLGLEASGTVVAVGAKVDASWIGKRVCGLCNGGAYAEFVALPAVQVWELPASVSDEEAATLPEALYTCHINLFKIGELQRDEVVLIHGGSGGIGHLAIQMAKAAGAYVITTAGSEVRRKFCLEMGADLAINYRERDFVTELKTREIKLDLVLDSVGGDYVQKHISLANTEARIVQIAFQGGAKVNLDLAPVMLKRLRLTGSTLRIRSRVFKRDCRDEILARWWPLIAEGKLKPRIHQVFDLNEVADSHRLLESGKVMGKVVLRCGK